MQTTPSTTLAEPHINSSEKNERISINHIFSHNHNWEVFKYGYGDELRPDAVDGVEKMLTCGNRGYYLYECPNCNEFKVIHFGCNSRICTHCGKKFTDKWADSIARKTFNVKHRHVVLTMPNVLWPLFYEDRNLLKLLMDLAITAIADVVERKLHYKAVPGVIAALHTYGKDMKFNPHLHCLVTEGGFKPNGEWVDVNYFPYEMLRKSWQDKLLNKLGEMLSAYESLVASMFRKYPDGFYVRARDTIYNKKGMMT